MATPSPPPSLHRLRGGPAQARAIPVPAGYAVSRSYAAPHALVATHPLAVGVDIEQVGPLPADFLATVGTPDERARFAGADPLTLTALWSGKEALAKALGDLADRRPDRLDSPLAWPGTTAGRWRARRLDPELPDGYVGWLVWAV